MALNLLDNLAGSTGTMKVMGQWGEPGLLAMHTCCPPLKPNPQLLQDRGTGLHYHLEQPEKFL